MRWVAEAVLALSPNPWLLHPGTGLSGAESRRASGLPLRATPGVLRPEKVPSKQVVQRLPRKQRYQPFPQGLKVLAALLALRDKVIQPLLAAALQTRPTELSTQPLFDELGIAA
jgi:hypothetical protein